MTARVPVTFEGPNSNEQVSCCSLSLFARLRSVPKSFLFCKEADLRFVALDVGSFSFAAGVARRVGCFFAISVCLAVALPLFTASAAHALSGYGSNAPAVVAQYPDSSASQLAPKPAVSNLGQAIARKRAVLRDPRVRAQVADQDAVIAQKATRAIATTAGLAPSQSGSIALLIAGVGVVALGLLLRWRRGLQN